MYRNLIENEKKNQSKLYKFRFVVFFYSLNFFAFFFSLLLVCLFVLFVLICCSAYRKSTLLYLSFILTLYK